LDHRQSGTFGLPGLPVKKFGAGTTINLEPGEYCILLNFTSFTHYPTYVDRDYAYMSGTGFRPLPVTVKPGYTARVAVPMGLLDVKLVPSSPYGISCTFTDAAGHYLPYIREFGESGQKVAMPPGDYNYVCGNRSKDPAQSTLVLQRGSFKIVEAHVATVKLTPRNGSNPDDYR
jgi:hypothetical protein